MYVQFPQKTVNYWFDFTIDFFTKFLDDSAWFCVEKLKKHGFEIKNISKY